MENCGSPLVCHRTVSQTAHILWLKLTVYFLLLAPLGSRSAGLAWSVSCGCCLGLAGVGVIGGLTEMLGQPDLCRFHVVSGLVLCV